ncbi:hypothetical protein EVAR_26549_1 [Eumeta japonica]|uniref:Uncharacterized protein n=1 Tax=Eumeta variegata TaxID=151549 RepID=A0A4C1W7F0_EUMVA|nr:hypothetical protein EVAR_26549_1 [Eumeta japonica]
MQRFAGGDSNPVSHGHDLQKLNILFDLKTKRQSAQWMFRFEELPSKVKRGLNVGKKMVASFFGMKERVSRANLEISAKYIGKIHDVVADRAGARAFGCSPSPFGSRPASCYLFGECLFGRVMAQPRRDCLITAPHILCGPLPVEVRRTWIRRNPGAIKTLFDRDAATGLGGGGEGGGGYRMKIKWESASSVDKNSFDIRIRSTSNMADLQSKNPHLIGGIVAFDNHRQNFN